MKDMQVQEEYQEAVKEFVRRAREKYDDKIDSTILFGSVARREAKKDSDIDILVIWNGDEAEGWRAMTGLTFDVLLDEEKYISTKVLGLEDLKAENPFTRKHPSGANQL
jgi:predicted nucleotidyltransferase